MTRIEQYVVSFTRLIATFIVEESSSNDLGFVIPISIHSCNRWIIFGIQVLQISHHQIFAIFTYPEFRFGKHLLTSFLVFELLSPAKSITRVLKFYDYNIISRDTIKACRHFSCLQKHFVTPCFFNLVGLSFDWILALAGLIERLSDGWSVPVSCLSRTRTSTIAFSCRKFSTLQFILLLALLQLHIINIKVIYPQTSFLSTYINEDVLNRFKQVCYYYQIMRLAKEQSLRHCLRR